MSVKFSAPVDGPDDGILRFHIEWTVGTKPPRRMLFAAQIQDGLGEPETILHIIACLNRWSHAADVKADGVKNG